MNSALHLPHVCHFAKKKVWVSEVWLGLDRGPQTQRWQDHDLTKQFDHNPTDEQRLALSKTPSALGVLLITTERIMPVTTKTKASSAQQLTLPGWGL